MFNKIIKFRKSIKFILLFLLLNPIFNSNSNILYTKGINKNNISYLENIDKYESNYILGVGDSLKIEFHDLPFFSSIYPINIDGYIMLPEIKRVKAEGFTSYELEKILMQKFSEILVNPDISIEIVKYRSLNIYISGEVKRPGLYKLDYEQNYAPVPLKSLEGPEGLISLKTKISQNPNSSKTSAALYQPRIFDAIQQASGISNYADLSNISIIRKNPISKGGGKIQAEINLLNLLVNGDINQNLTLLDGDSINIPRSTNLVKDQILIGANSNLNPSQIRIFITGNVISSGAAILNNGTSLVQAIASAGGKKRFTGSVEFIRFESNGNAIKNSFKFKDNAPVNTSRNPILMDGDIIHVNKTFLGTISEFLSETETPLITGYGIYKLFD